MLYYYLATILGLTLLLVGSISAAQGLVHRAIPESSPDYYVETTKSGENGKDVSLSPSELAKAKAQARQEARQTGAGEALDGLIEAIVGAPVFLWHLTQVRKRERERISVLSETNPRDLTASG
ncbi:MAG: hypothetical protein ACR2FO_03915 [Actinomycetota bacterium]